MPTLANAQLSQRKLVSGTAPSLKYWTQESVTLQLGLLSTPFKIYVAGTTELMTVATYDDVKAGTPLTYNPMSGFSRGTSFTGVAATGDVLEITNAPEYWGGVAGVNPTFLVSSVDGSGNLVLATPFWTRETTLAWALKRGGATRATGTAGSSQRLNTATNYYLDSQFQSSYFTANEALTHIAYTQTMLESLTAAISAATAEFTKAPNPLTSNYVA